MDDPRARLRNQLLIAMGLVGCHAPQASNDAAAAQTVALTPTAASSSSVAPVVSATATASASATVPPVPTAIAHPATSVPEPNCAMCMIKCEPAGTTPVVGTPLPAPYDRCASTIESGAGELSPQRTDSARLKDPSSCCYAFPNRHPFLGRPLRVEGTLRVAPSVARADWRTALGGSVAELDAGERALRARAWQDAAAAEHASVASFARFALQLLAVGAPPELLAEAHQAARDEVLHARVSYEIASAYAGEDLGPGPLPMGDLRITADLATMARETFEDGCVSETVAALDAGEKAAVETDPVLRAALSGIADDEARHAALAWKTVAWALRVGGDEVRVALVASFARVERGSARIEECVVPCASALLAA